MRILIIILLLLPVLVQGQKCKFEKQKIEKKSGDTILSSKLKTEFIGLNTTFSYRFKKINSQVLLHFEYYKRGYDQMSVFKDNKLLLNLHSGETISLQTVEDFEYQDKWDDATGSRKIWAAVDYPIEAEQLAKISKHPLAWFRIFTDDIYFDEAVDEKDGYKFMFESGCMLTTIQ